VQFTRGQADVDWGDWKDGLDGWKFRLPKVVPKFDLSTYKVDAEFATFVKLSCGVTWPIAPAAVDNTVIGLDLEIDPTASATEYGALALKLFERAESQAGLERADKDLIRFCRLAMMRTVGITEEEIAAHRLLTLKDVTDIFHAAAGIPKADPGAAC
jgi:hypothetical protein